MIKLIFLLTIPVNKSLDLSQLILLSDNFFYKIFAIVLIKAIFAVHFSEKRYKIIIEWVKKQAR
jgi:hypothetical protein